MTKKRRLLIVDDDKALLDLLQTVFTARDWECSEAGSISRAKEILSDQWPDLILIDGLLPDGIGIDLIEDLRNQGFDGEMGFMSSFFQDMKTYRRLREDLSIQLIVRKPLQPEELYCQVESLFKTQSTDLGADAFEGEQIPGSEDDDSSGYSIDLPEPQDPLARLKAGYAETLAQKLNDLLDNLRNASLDKSDAIDAALHLAHKLHGTAGTFGFQEVSQIAGYIEESVRDVVEGKRKSDPELWKELTDLVERLQSSTTNVEKPSPLAEEVENKRQFFAHPYLS